jgi:glucose-6-phosphate isomerase
MYADGVSNLIVTTECGKRVQIHKRHLRSFITHEGLQGRFAVWVDADHRFLKIERV